VDRIYAAVLWACFLAVACSNAAAQYSDDEENDDPRANLNVGAIGALGLNPTARFANTGWGATVGAGYNFTRNHGIVGEFMWTHLFATDQALAAARSLALNPGLDGAGNLFAVTGNYRYERRGSTFGAYFIGGGGLYVRQVYFSKPVAAPPGVPCAQVWSWWGFSCVAGALPPGQTVHTTNDLAPGANGGIGLTTRAGQAPNRLYVEARYHYAANSGVNTQLVTISFGIRY
jgi:hypothetical protein